MSEPVRKSRFRSMTTSYSEKINRHQTGKPLLGEREQKRSLGHTRNLSDKKLEPEENALHIEKSQEVYLKDELYVSVCPPKKKKGSSKLRTVQLQGNGLVISDGKNEQIFPLNSLCMIIREEDPKKSVSKSPRLVKSSPFGSRSKDKDKASSDRTMLLLTHDLTRIWVKFMERKDFLLWVLSVDGLLTAFYSSSLIETVHKVITLTLGFKRFSNEYL